MEKVIRDGNVAVLVSHGYGAGWYSWHGKKELLFHPTLVELVEADKNDEITEDLCKQLVGTDEYICVIGADGLQIHWIPEGTAFQIDEYDGAESLKTHEDLYLIA
jgi:hypothetical protein